jgi:hypothetical protein
MSWIIAGVDSTTRGRWGGDMAVVTVWREAPSTLTTKVSFMSGSLA